MKNKYRLLILITITTTFLDLIIIHNGWHWSGYVLMGWLVVWSVTWLVVGKFLLSIGWVFVISVAEDFLYLLSESIMGARPFWPLYSHGWVGEATGGLFGFLGQNWLGLPSSYWLGLVVGIPVIIYFESQYRKVAAT